MYYWLGFRISLSHAEGSVIPAKAGTCLPAGNNINDNTRAGGSVIPRREPLILMVPARGSVIPSSQRLPFGKTGTFNINGPAGGSVIPAKAGIYNINGNTTFQTYLKHIHYVSHYIARTASCVKDYGNLRIRGKKFTQLSCNIDFYFRRWNFIVIEFIVDINRQFSIFKA